MSSASAPARHGSDLTGGLGVPILVGMAVVATMVAFVVVTLLTMGMWYVAVALLAVVPAFYLLHRYPFVALTVWLAVNPFLMSSEGGGDRKIYWIIHRFIPLGTLAVMVVSRWVGVRKDRLPRLGWPEAMMAGYVVLTLLSIAYRSLEPSVTFFYMFDHVIIPMCIYLIVRLSAPDDDDLRSLIPVLVFLLITQSIIGIVGWVAPESLPSGWLGREDRATGTLRHPNVYATTLLFAALYLTHASQALRRQPALTRFLVLMLPIAAIMSVVTLSRAAWFAAAVVVVGLYFAYPRLSRRMIAVAVLAGVGMLMGGMLGSTQETLSHRVNSEESALSRLPVALASVRMIEAKPFVGWGYENFNRYDFEFTGSIDGLYVPDKDHSSHNFFLTLGAEGGLIGLALYLGPAFYWLVKSRAAAKRLPEEGFRSQKLVRVMWLALAAQVVAYNFSNNRVAFGLGVWWLTLGLLATACDWQNKAAMAAEDDVRARIAALATRSP